MLTALMILAAASPQSADPLAEARAGKVQCVVPNDATKKCMGISTYKINSNGSFETQTTLLIAPTPLITMTVASPGTVKGDALCGPVSKAEFMAAKIEMDGQPANEAVASAVRSQVVASIESMDGKMSCATQAADGTVTVTLDGVARPELTAKTKWVAPGEYTLGQ